ncbi:MAG: hypothetical protein IPH07_10020 [Deltaproteobacteria bacterium]|nr:hypothetical protein [Deltaproteobacteria bacterium]MBK8718769.1 hypothetical protein [Deltaproteobacteria bacterium]MBP7286482.1 hypothetical protein [Nannocystaceae bacterium]
MTISAKTRKMLWGRCASRCSFPECRRELVMDIAEADDPTVVGEEAHIVAREADGPRGASSMTADQRDLYGNLVLLCSIHHKIADDNEQAYPVARLHEIKKAHEDWVRTSLAGFDPIAQREEEQLIGYVDEWAEKCELDNWKNWTSWIFGGGQPQLRVERAKSLHACAEWLFNRVWPNRHPRVKEALANFRWVLNDFLRVMHSVSTEEGRDENKVLVVEKVYKKMVKWDREEEKRLSVQFEFAVDLVEDLCFELTRAANSVCDEVRRHLLPGYRLTEGVLLVERGPDMSLRTSILRAEYPPETDPADAYPGLQRFFVERATRTPVIGSGEPPEQLKWAIFGFTP